MKRSEFLLLLDDLVDLPPGTLKGPEPLESIEQWNSLAVVSFIALVDEHYSFTIEPRKIMRCKIVSELLDLAESGRDRAAAL